jgi:hypothetical protein
LAELSEAEKLAAILGIGAKTELLDQLDTRLDAVMAELTPSSVHYDGRTLYHYTGASGFLEILRTRQLWATDAAHTNDSLELSYGPTLVREMLAKNPLPAEMRDPGPGAAFVVCFSEDGDSLSQWRAYGGDGLGYAIGFKFDSLPHPVEDPLAAEPEAEDEDEYPTVLAREKTFSACRLTQVMYDRKEQEDIITRVAARLSSVYDWFSVASATSEEAIAASGKFHFASASAFSEHVGVFKNPSFAHEREWRFLLERNWASYFPPMETQYRASRFGLTPFVPLAFATRTMPIVEVVVGPRIPWTIGQNAVEGLLARSGYQVSILGNQVQVRQSKASYR